MSKKSHLDNDLTERSALEDGLLEFRLLLRLQGESNTGDNDSDDSDGNSGDGSRGKTILLKVGLSCESVHEAAIQQSVLLLKNLSTIGSDVLSSPLVSFLGGFIIVIVLVVLVVLVAVVALIFGNGGFIECSTCLRRLSIFVLE